MEPSHLHNLRELLLQNKQWPLSYMFKFIVPNTDQKVERIVQIMPPHGQISYKHTKNLRHVAITCVANMNSADQIVETTQKALEIDGVIAL